MTKASALQKAVRILQNDNEQNDKSERIIITESDDGVTMTRES